MSTTALHGKNSVFLSDQYDLSAYYKTFSFKHSKKADESTVFGLTDRTFVPGMQSGTVSGGGLFRGAASAADADTVLRAALGDSTSGQILTVGAGGFAIGKRCRLWQSRRPSAAVSWQTPAAQIVEATCSNCYHSQTKKSREIPPAS